MNIGLCGANGAGKSTLAGEFARRNKQYVFVATPTTEIMVAHGFNPAIDYPMRERLHIQGIILTELDKCWASFKENAIFDRTPLDTAAYLLADVQRANVPEHFHADIVAYVERCLSICNRRFSLIIQLPPVLPVERERRGKAPSSPAFVEHHHQLVAGLRSDERMKVRHLIMPRNYIDLDMRTKALEASAGRVMRNYLVESETHALNGNLSH